MAATLNLSGEWALLVGGGAVALRRARTLRAAGLSVRVVAPDILAELAELASDCRHRAFEPHDLRGVRLVVACTGSAQVNDEVIRLARAEGLLANHSGNAEAGNLRFPAVVRRGGLTVTVTSDASLPLLAQAASEKILLALPDSLPLGEWTAQRDAALHLAGAARQAALAGLRRQIRAHLDLPLEAAQ
ncbi:siroheme synthase [Deinococcus irradiatisoli]|uniref:precorrin-2 dehydrogenase n=1 Tax=Deinococcus irradiatisoli TaxID=2202254 RepID=A0A2Z3JNG1_9DEIO|nr:siroheme synthase [Deinococcus irradiatisoli]